MPESDGAPAEGAVQEGGAPGAPEAGADEGTEADPFDSSDVQTFDRAYVQKLRDEAAKHRTAKQRYEEAFKGWEGEDADVWLDVIQAAADPNSRGSAADQLRQIADLLAPGAAKDAANAAADAAEKAGGEDVDTEDRPLTKAELDKIFAEREAEAEKNRLLKEIEDEAKGLGYEKNTAGYAQLMFYANFNTKGDLQKAHELIEADRQKIIDDYIAEKSKDADLPGGNTNAGTFSVSEDKKPKSISDASNALREALAAQAAV